jgi:hypothetical protein
MPRPVRIPVEVALSLTVEVRTFHDLLREMRRESRRALLRALRAALGHVEKTLLTGAVLCPSCQRPMRNRGRSARRIVSPLGPLDFRRVRFSCVSCRTVRRPLDEWLGLVEGTEYTTAVREQALYLAAELPYERAADVLRHVGGVGISGRQIQRLLEAESEQIEAVLGAEPAPEAEASLRRRFRRAGKAGAVAGAQRVLQLRQLKASGRWDEYWAARFQQACPDPMSAGVAARRHDAPCGASEPSSGP